jgi:hypothetical protein
MIKKSVFGSLFLMATAVSLARGLAHAGEREGHGGDHLASIIPTTR